MSNEVVVEVKREGAQKFVTRQLCSGIEHIMSFLNAVRQVRECYMTPEMATVEISITPNLY